MAGLGAACRAGICGAGSGLVTARPRRRKVAKPADIDPVPLRQGPVVIPDPPEVRAVQVNGAFIDSVNVVPKTIASLVMTLGRLGDPDDEDRPKVLVPFAEVRLGGGPIKEMLEGNASEEEEPPTLFLTSLPLENLAYVLLDLTGDLKRMCYEICSVGHGELAVDPARMAHVRYFMAHLERQARLCRIRLDQTFGPPELGATAG